MASRTAPAARRDSIIRTPVATDSAGNVYVADTNAQKIRVAEKDKELHVTVQTNPVGESFTVDGVAYNSTQTFAWNPGSSHTIATTLAQPAGTGIRYLWSYWSDTGKIAHTIVADVEKTVTATFTKQYQLTMIAGSGGTVTPSTAWKNDGSKVAISAVPGTGYSFTNWNGNGVGS